MVETRPGRRLRADGLGNVAVGTFVLAVLAGTGAFVAATSSVPALLVLVGIAVAGSAIAWLQGRAARIEAERASADLASLASRLIELEAWLVQQQAVTLGAEPALRSTVEEVTGEIGLLGGLVRDLAETVAAQDRDVANLRERLSSPSDDPDAGPGTAPESAHPEPSLLPSTRTDAEWRRGGDAPAVTRSHGETAESGLAKADARRLAAALRREDNALSDADAHRMAAIVEAFEADRMELHLQPIVALPQRKIRFYEVLARLRLADETILFPAEFLPLLEGLGHAAEFDNRVTGRAIVIARHLMARGSEAIVSVNLSPRAVEDAGFLRSLVRKHDEHADTAGRVVFELSQRCWRTLDAERAGGLAALRDRGVPFALDRATDLRLDPLALADRGVRFVKVPTDLLLGDQNPGLDIETRDLAGVLRRAGIKLVAERVEREETVPDLVDLDVPLAQGFVFAAPRAVRSEVLTSPLSSEAPAGPAPASGSQAGMPDRAFLPRAG